MDEGKLMNRRAILIGVAAAAVVAAGVAVVLPADASTQNPADGVAPQILSTMQRDLGLTADQARARVAREHRATSTQATLSARLGPAFAGAWLTGNADALVVAVTDPAQASRVKAAGARPVVVSRTLGQLQAVRAKLDRAAPAVASGVTSWYIDVASNSVVMVARQASAAKALIAATGTDPAAVRTVESADAPRPLYDVRGGDAYNINNSARCSIGFSVVGGFVTAGHCGQAGSSTTGSNVAQGTFQGSRFPGADYAWVRVNGNWTPRPVVNDYRGGTVTVAGSQEAPVGASVCRSGSTSGWHCGTIQAKNVTVNYAQGAVYGLTQTNACAEPGDSGGSWISGNQAQGVTSGGSGNCSSGGTTFFQPINPILSTYGLTLVTTGGGGGNGGGGNGGGGNGGGGGGNVSGWQPNHAYTAGQQVAYGGRNYRCIQSHTSQSGWEPPNVPALWQPVG